MSRSPQEIERLRKSRVEFEERFRNARDAAGKRYPEITRTLYTDHYTEGDDEAVLADLERMAQPTEIFVCAATTPHEGYDQIEAAFTTLDAAKRYWADQRLGQQLEWEESPFEGDRELTAEPRGYGYVAIIPIKLDS